MKTVSRLLYCPVRSRSRERGGVVAGLALSWLSSALSAALPAWPGCDGGREADGRREARKPQSSTGGPTAPHFICASAERRLSLVAELNCSQVVPAARLQEAHARRLPTSGPDEVRPQVPGCQGVGQSFCPDQGPLPSLSSMPCVHGEQGQARGRPPNIWGALPLLCDIGGT